MGRLLAVLACALALGLAGAASAAAPQPDAHDTALAQQLAARVQAFQTLDKAGTNSSANRLQTTLQSCPDFKRDPGKALGAVFALLPALLIDVVNQYRPQILELRATVAKMHPHAQLFSRWLDAEGQSLGLLLSFDNHGKKVDYCRAAHVMLEKNPSQKELKDVFGIDPALIAKIFSGGSSNVSATLQKLNPQMRAFLVAAGVAPKTATALTG
jgi:hypothetical protein